MRYNNLDVKKWYTADLHFGHEGIIKFCNRPFQNADQADETMLRNLHERVGPGDQLWVIGDFSMGRRSLDKKWLKEMFDRLPGAEKYLVTGNHDDDIIKALGWTSVIDIAEVRDGSRKQFNTLFHYPMVTWNHARRGAYQLFGHVHDNWLGTRNCVNVGVDVWDFYPVSFGEIEQRSSQLPVNKHWNEAEPECDIMLTDSELFTGKLASKMSDC